jgi:hypothetical protein
MFSTIRPALRPIVVATSVLLVAAITAGGPVASARAASSPAASPPAASALAWLSTQLDANEGMLPSSFGPTDWGLTSDFVLALAAGGQGGDPAATTATDALRDHIASYVSGVDFGAPDDRYAGAIAKSMLVAELEQRDPTHFGGFDLDTSLRGLMQTTGPQAGRFSDHSDFGDFSNGLGQALAVMGLARTSGGVPGASIAFLLAQQCPAGGFRLDYDATAGCGDDGQADPDATSFAVDALLTQTANPVARGAIFRGVAWLEGRQDASGGVGGVGPTAAVNANSTGLAGQAFLAAKHASSAAKAAAWVTARQLTSANAGAASADVGAIGYDDGTLASAQSNGITNQTRGTWWRSTAQAVLGLGLPAYSQVGLPQPEASAALSTTSLIVGEKVTLTASGFAYGETVSLTLHSAAVAVGSFAADDAGTLNTTFVVPAIEAGAHELTLTGETSAVTLDVPVTVAAVATPEAGPGAEQPATAAGTLPVTGGPTGPEVVLAGLLIGAGALLEWVARRRRSTSTAGP